MQKEGVDREVNQEAHAVFEAELEKKKKRLADVRTAREVLSHFFGGIAEGMPLGEALGFLENEITSTDFTSPLGKGEPRFGDIQAAKSFLGALLVDAEANLSREAPVGEVLEFLEKEEKELTDLTKE